MPKRLDPKKLDGEFEIIAHVETLLTFDDGGTLELNKVRFKENRVKWDLRRYRIDPDGTRYASSGITLSNAGIQALKEALRDI